MSICFRDCSERRVSHVCCNDFIVSNARRGAATDALGLMFTFGMFILLLLTYIDRNQKK